MTAAPEHLTEMKSESRRTGSLCARAPEASTSSEAQGGPRARYSLPLLASSSDCQCGVARAQADWEAQAEAVTWPAAAQ